MKKAIWIGFVILTLCWTGFAFLVAGIARWTSDAVASERFAETTEWVALGSGRVAQTVTDSTGRAVDQVAAAVAQAVGGEAAGDAQAPVEASKSAAKAPLLPPLPAWVNQWLPAETVRSIEEWGVWANSAAHAGKAAITNPAKASARAVSEALSEPRSEAASTAGELEVEAYHPAEAAAISPTEIQKENQESGVPWLASLIGWLVPIVWTIWGIGLVLGLLLTLLIQRLAGRLMEGLALKPVSPI